MTEPGTFDPNDRKLQPLGPPAGLLEQLNVPPKMIAFMRRNQRSLWAAVIGVVVVSLALAGFDAYREHRQRRAASALDAALIAKQDKRSRLEKVVTEFGRTDSALWAKVELAFLEEREGQPAKAIDRLEAINSGLSTKAPLKPLVIGKLAALHENAQHLDKALQLYTELSGWEQFAVGAYRALGRVYEQLGNKEQAAAMYGKYLESESAAFGAAGRSLQAGADPMREMVQSRRNQLQKEQPATTNK